MNKPVSVLILSVLLPVTAVAQSDVRMKIQEGAVNGVLLQAGDVNIAVYGWEGPEKVAHVLLSHGRRDVVWKAESAIASGAEVVAPAGERFHLEQADEFWQRFEQSRYHDYAQQTTKILPAPIKVSRWIQDGDVLNWNGLQLKTVETPGYTRSAASFVADIGGRKVAFTGDLIVGDGQIPDLYSFQDAIPEAQVRGYHGYGSRLAALIESLRRIAALKPDVLIPARGSVIDDPQAAIARLISRVQKLYRNYLSTNALHWYFREDRMRICGERVLGPGAQIELMPFSHYEDTPDWIFERGTSRLLLSDSGRGFLLDCGNQGVIDTVRKLIDDGAITGVDGIFVTHYHDDHTDSVQAAAETFDCPVYATREYADVLSRPSAWHLPAMTANAIRDVKVLEDGHKIKWNEFTLTFHFFPGQTYYHGALFAEKSDQRPVFFIGDAFAPSGFDDYCVLNRNLVSEDSGYLYCLKKLRSIQQPFWLVNEHIPHVFSYSPAELNYLEDRYRTRIETLKELIAWDDPNYGVDEQWAVLYPRRLTARAGQSVTLELRITNHSSVSRTFDFDVHLPDGLDFVARPASLTIKPHETSAAPFAVSVKSATAPLVISADIAAEGIDVRRWADAVVTPE